ncbi:MAG: ABC transporter substrate-binding protein [Candidatus Odinarchaeota archaeon]
MKKKYLSLLLTALFVFATLLPLMQTNAAPEEAAQDPIKIGFFGALTTSTLAYYTPWSQQAFELGLEYATGGTNATTAGRPYEIKYYDTKGDPTTAAIVVTNAIETDGVDILVGGTLSSVAPVISSKAEEYKKIYFAGPAAASSLTGKNFNRYIFRIPRNSWHDAKAGVSFAMDVIGAKKFGFLAADYSFGYDGVAAMQQLILEKGGLVNSIQYADPYLTVDFTSYITNLLLHDTYYGIDMLFIIWAGNFNYLYPALISNNVAAAMNISGAVVDIKTMNEIEATLTPPATLVGSVGLCVYGYELPNNTVNDWMVQQYDARNITPNAGQIYQVPELFSAGAFGTAQFLVNVTNAVPDLNVEGMITHLESGLNITTPKGPTYLRPQDHQGLSEMYIAEIINDTRADSQTYHKLIAKLNQTLPASVVAPPIESGYDPRTTTTTTPSGSVSVSVSVSQSVVTVTPGFSIITLVISLSSVAVTTFIVRSGRKRKT